MTPPIPTQPKRVSPFEAIRHEDEDGSGAWMETGPQLGDHGRVTGSAFRHSCPLATQTSLQGRRLSLPATARGWLGRMMPPST